MKQPSDRVDGNNNLRAAFRTPMLVKAHKAALKAGVPALICDWAGGGEAWFTECWLQSCNLMCEPVPANMTLADVLTDLEELEGACRIGLAELGIDDPALVPSFSHLAWLRARAQANRGDA